MLERDQKKLWAHRAKNYNKLAWVHDPNLQKKVVECGQFMPHHTVLDAGTGTGAIAYAVSPYVREVCGIDQSEPMLEGALANLDGYRNIRFELGDVRNIQYPDAEFDRVTSRNVFHNILEYEDRLKAASECMRILKSGGRFILSEGVPPHDSLKEDFERIFALKETRIVFTSGDLAELVKKAGCSRIEVHHASSKDFNLSNWLDNDGTLENHVKQEIIDLHLNGTDDFKRHYNLRLIEGEVLIDTISAFVVGIM